MTRREGREAPSASATVQSCEPLNATAEVGHSPSPDLLATLFGGLPDGHAIAIVAITPGKKGAPIAAMFDASSITEATNYGVSISTKREVYFTPCASPIDYLRDRKKHNGRNDAGHASYLTCLWADLDLGSLKPDGKPYPPSIADAISCFPFPPSAIVHTGHGAHAYWILDRPVPVTDANRDLPARWIALGAKNAAERGWVLDSVGDLARILRVPETIHHKTGKTITLESGCGTVRYTLERLAAAIPDDVQVSGAGEQRDPVNFTITDGPMHDKVAQTVATCIAEITHPTANGSRHDTTRDATMAIVRLSERGYTGGAVALKALRPVFIAAVADRSDSDAAGKEFDEFVRTAHHKVSTTKATTAPADAMDQWLADLDSGAPRTVEERPVMRPEAFHGIAGRIVAELAPTTEADPAAMLAILLTQVGCVLNSGPHVEVGASKHPARLFAAVVGKTSRARKDTAEREVRRIVEEAAGPDWAVRVLGGFGSGEAVVDHVRDPDPNDDKDQGVRDRRLLVHESELARIFRAASRDGSTLSMIVRQAWDGDRLEARTRQRTVTATGAHICIAAGITAEELRRELSGVEIANGFGNRFLYVWAERAQLLPSGGGLPHERVTALGRDLADAITTFRRFTRFARTPEGEARWAEVYRRLAEEGDQYEGVIGALTARAEPMTLRLSLIFAGLDGTNEIGPEHIDAALAVWDYSQDTVKHIYRGSTGNPLAERLLSAISEAGEKGLTGAEQWKAVSGHGTKEEMATARRVLEDRGSITTAQIKTRGRPSLVSVLARQESKAKEVGTGSRDEVRP